MFGGEESRVLLRQKKSGAIGVRNSKGLEVTGSDVGLLTWKKSEEIVEEGRSTCFCDQERFSTKNKKGRRNVTDYSLITKN